MAKNADHKRAAKQKLSKKKGRTQENIFDAAWVLGSNTLARRDVVDVVATGHVRPRTKKRNRRYKISLKYRGDRQSPRKRCSGFVKANARGWKPLKTNCPGGWS